jgi:cytochrome c biogenesis factor
MLALVMPHRRLEFLCALTAVLAALLVALTAKPLPPLLDAVGDDAWARGIEFGLLTFSLLVLLAAVGILRSKITIGPVGAEPLVLAATQETIDATRHLGERMKDLATIVDLLAQQNQALEKRVEALSSGEDVAVPQHLEAPDD